MKKLDFRVPFTGFAHLSWFNAFAAAYVHIEGFEGKTDYDCPKETSGQCNGCGNCRGGLGGIQESWYFLFQTLSACAAYQQDFSATLVCPDQDEEVFDFCMKLAGYRYERITEDLPNALRASIDAGIPAIAWMKEGDHGPARVLIGYDGDELIMAEPKGAQNPPEQAPAYGDIARLYIIKEKGAPERTLLDGLRRIERVMQSNLDRRIWDEAKEPFDYWNGNLSVVSFEDLKNRFDRIKSLAWNFDNCHNFSEAFRQAVFEPLRDSRLEEARRTIDRAYDDSHTRHWQLIALYECRDWTNRRYNELEWGMCECVRTALTQLKANDEQVLAAVRDMIALLEQNEPVYK